MIDHKQYNLEPNKDVPTPSTDYISSPNVFRLDKSLVIKDKFNVNDTEAHSKIGSKVKVHNILQQDSATYGVLLDDFIVAVTDAGVARTINLPKASLAGLGKVFIIKDSSGSISSTTITIEPNGSELINGDTNYVISTNFGTVGVYTDGSNWFSV